MVDARAEGKEEKRVRELMCDLMGGISVMEDKRQIDGMKWMMVMAIK